MELHFLQPWLVFAAAATALTAGAIAWKTRRSAPMLFALAAAALFLSGARPQLGTKPEDVRHALVIDVSGSMAARTFDPDALVGIDLPPSHSFIRFELSDAARAPGSAKGDGTDFGRLADVAGDPRINGEIVLITDGRGDIAQLYESVHPHRLIVLPAPAPDSPDASVMWLSAPGSAAPGSNVEVVATVHCDSAAEVPWRLSESSREIASGKLTLAPNTRGTVRRNYLIPAAGPVRLRFTLGLMDDREPRNDEAETGILISGKRRVEYCTPDGIAPQQDALLQSLLGDPQNDVRVRDSLPLTKPDLEDIDLLVINNLSLQAAGATREQTAVLADWVNGGGRLFMVGTDGAFGPGGYRGSPLEDVMPVRFRPEDEPPRRTLLLLDVSSSMNDPVSGGETRLARLKLSAVRALGSLGKADTAAIAGFREGIKGNAEFLPADSEALIVNIDALVARGSTHIGTSLQQASALVSEVGDSRILMITDGQDVEKLGQEAFEQIAADLARNQTRLDVVLTGDEDLDWPAWLAGAHIWRVGEAGFDGLFDTLDQALAGGDSEWVSTDGAVVRGIENALPRFVRTAARNESSVTRVLSAELADKTYPLLARRQLVGRTASLCTDSWGSDAGLVAFWQDSEFQRQLGNVLDFVLGDAGRVNLLLNPLENGAELVWTGPDQAPTRDLRLEPSGTAVLESPGVWTLGAWPLGDELRVFDGGRLLQRIALPRLVPAELRETGNDPVFFAVAQEGGIRVFNSLNAWQPRRVISEPEEPLELTWLPALLAMVLLTAGFALRRK